MSEAMSEAVNPPTRRGTGHVRWKDEEDAKLFEMKMAEIKERAMASFDSSRVALRGSSEVGETEPSQDTNRDRGDSINEPPAQMLHAEEPNGLAAIAKAFKIREASPIDVRHLQWHTLSSNGVAQKLSTSTTHGLFEDQAATRLLERCKNAPSTRKIRKTPKIYTVLGYLFNGFGSLFLLSGILLFLSWKPFGQTTHPNHLALAIVLLVMFFIQAGFAVFHDWLTSNFMHSLKYMVNEEYEVTRSGKTMLVPASELVPGDLITIRAGNKLPADVRFISASSDASFDRSDLFGESAPVASSFNSTDTNYLKTKNIGLQGTHCLSGSCKGLVVATGEGSFFGRIVDLTNKSKTGQTPLKKDTLFLMLIILVIIIGFIAIMVFLWAGWLRKDYPNWISAPDLITYCMTLTLAIFPEGLPMAITLALTIVSGQLAKNSILCKSLKAIETLGSVSTLFSDKTGTLTEGRMAVVSCCFGGRAVTVEEAQKRRIPEMARAIARGVTSVVGQLGAISALCNNANIVTTSEAYVAPSELEIQGDATDAALLRFSEELKSGNVSHFRDCWEKAYQVAFDSKNRFMMCCFRKQKPEDVNQTMPSEAAEAFKPYDLLLTIKGDPEVLMGRCSHYLTNAGAVALLDADAIAAFVTFQNTCFFRGQRCLLLAQKTVHKENLEDETGLRQFEAALKQESEAGLLLVGLVAIIDPLRPETQEVVSVLRGAGMRVVMATGDSPGTALAVAREAGIVTSVQVDNAASLRRTPDTISREGSESSSMHEKEAILISGPEIFHFSMTQWKELFEYKEIVFAKLTPEEKLTIVSIFQTKEKVAMLGDGVNDAPALKAADIGIATSNVCDATLEAADMLLLNDISALIPAVYYGRLVFDNLKKISAYLLPAGSFAQCWAVLAPFIFGLPQVLSPFLMVLMCCLTELSAAAALCFEKGEGDILLRPPQDRNLVSTHLLVYTYCFLGAIQTFASFAMSYFYLHKKGIPFETLWMSYGRNTPTLDQETYNAALRTASSIFFVTLIVTQWFVLLTTRTSRLSIFQYPPFFNKRTSNWRLGAAIFFSWAAAMFVLHIPPLQRALGTRGVPVEYWFFPFVAGIIIMFLDEMKKLWIRKWPDGSISNFAS